MADTIDQVIQNGEPSPQLHARVSNPNLSSTSINKTSPLPPLPSSSSSLRRDTNLRSNSQLGINDRNGGGDISSKQSSVKEDEGSGSSRSGHTLNGSGMITTGGVNITDFFSPEIFQIVIHNPTTAHRFLKFCQSRNCGENMEFLQKVDAYNRLIDEVTQALSSIHSTYTSSDASRQINISHSLTKRVSSDIRQATQLTLPSLENIFPGAQEHVERLLAADIYPRFVKHQVTTSATMALSDHRTRFEGLGDCFCLTDPSIADNPITYASDGFVSVTGYSRRDIVPRNCRFLSGELTDPASVRRLRESIHNCEETVELLLNYRKNGDPFWNLLYVSPLLNERGEVVYFLGGQINCSTTIHSCTDILKVLSVKDDEFDKVEENATNRPPSVRSKESYNTKPKSSFFKNFRKYNATPDALKRKISVRDEAGMEPELLHRLGKLNFRTQVEAFYTAYSKYLILAYQPTTQNLTIEHYSPGVIDMLCLNLPNGGIAPIFHKDIFKVLVEHSGSSSSSAAKAFRETVRAAVSKGKPVSVETGLLTGFEERKERSGFRGMGGRGGGEKMLVRVEEKYVTHWTPLKDEEGRTGWVVLTIAPKV